MRQIEMAERASVSARSTPIPGIESVRCMHLLCYSPINRDLIGNRIRVYNRFRKWAAAVYSYLHKPLCLIILIKITGTLLSCKPDSTLCFL
jgi:hypothetical protein